MSGQKIVYKQIEEHKRTHTLVHPINLKNTAPPHTVIKFRIYHLPPVLDNTVIVIKILHCQYNSALRVSNRLVKIVMGLFSPAVRPIQHFFFISVLDSNIHKNSYCKTTKINLPNCTGDVQNLPCFQKKRFLDKQLPENLKLIYLTNKYFTR